MAQPAFIYPRMHSTPFWATQVESRLPATRHRRSLLQAPKTISNSIKSPDLKSINVVPSVSPSGIPQKTSVLHSKHLLIGQRVWTADGRIGTLEFKGKTHFSQGCLCGIRLDDPLGKNDGSVDGIQYFECSPNHGIFIHAFKVQAVNSASEGKPLELAPNSSGKIASLQQGSGKETKPASKIPALGLSGKIARPKSLAVNDDKPQPVGRRGLAKRTEISRIECFSAEKASNGSKLFQKKRISPADSGITVPGWTHDRTLQSRLPSIHSKSPSTTSHDATFTVAHDQSQPQRNQSSHRSPPSRSPPSRKKTPEQSSPRTRKSSSGSLQRGLASQPSLNDLTQLLEDDSSKLKKDGTRQKTSLNETFKVGKSPRGFPSLKTEKKHAKESTCYTPTATDLNSTSPLSWDAHDKVTSTPLSSTENTYYWESDGISQSDIKDTFVVPDAEEGDDIEYNEFWAVPSALDTPTGRLRFDLLTPEEFEQALKDCNIPLDSPQSETAPPLVEESDSAPKLTDHCKPKVLESLTVVEDDLLVGSDTTFYNIPSFLVPAWSMELETTAIEASQLESTEEQVCNSVLDQAAVGDEQLPGEEFKAVPKWSTEDSSDITNNNTEIVNQPESKISPKGKDRTSCADSIAMNESDGIPCGSDLQEKPASITEVPDGHSTSSNVHHEDCNEPSEDDKCVYTDDLSNEWQNLVQQAETDFVGETSCPNPCTLEKSLSPETNSGGASSNPSDLTSAVDYCHVESLQQQMTATFVTVGDNEKDLTVENRESTVCIESNQPKDQLKAVSPSVTLNILSTGYENATSPEKEKSFASEGSSESASTVIADMSPDQEQNKPLTIKERCPSAELETVTQFEMAEMTSPSYDKKKFGPELLNSTFSATQSNERAQIESQKGKENGDSSKLPKKRMSYLQQPKSFSSTRDNESSVKSNVAATKLKLTAVKSLDCKTETSSLGSSVDNKAKRGYKPGSWKSNKNPTSAANKGHSSSSNAIPKQKAAELPKQKAAGPLKQKAAEPLKQKAAELSKQKAAEAVTNKDSNSSIKRVSVKSKIDTGRKSIDMTGNKSSFTLPNKKSSGQTSTSSLEVEPNSLSSSNRSMKSDLSGVVTRTSSRSSSIGGKPANKTTSSLRHTDRNHSERKISTSTVNSDASLRTESKTSLSSRLSTSTSDAKHAKRPRPAPRKDSNPPPRLQTFSFSRPSRPAPVSLVKSSAANKGFPGKQSDGNQSKNDSQPSSSLTNGITAVDAAPVRRTSATRLQRTSLLPNKKADSTHQNVTRRPSVGKEADATKSAKGRSSPSPTSDHGLLVKANADVKRLEALCEGRTKELNMVKMNLKSGLQGFEAMTILVQYLTQKLDAFANPYLKTRIQEIEVQLEDAKSLTVQKEDELGCIQRELVDTRRSNEEQISELQNDHLEQLTCLEQRLNNQHVDELDRVQDKHKSEITAMKEDHIAQISEVTSSHHQAVHEMEEHHIEEVSEIQQQHQEHMEELNRQHDEDKKQLREEMQSKKQELQDEIYKWTFQCENQKERVIRLEEALQKDSDSKVQAAILEKRKLEADVDSMKSVADLRANQLSELRRESMLLKKELEKLPIKEDVILRLQAKVEDLQAMVAEKQNYQRQLSSDHITLRENYEREVNEKKRLSMEKEQLSWRLSLHSENSSPVGLSPHSFTACTSPSRSPVRSPTSTKKDLSRSSSMESHESGVFSPHTG
ncbi:uncharacterized protein [Asterias amurensis]|uniref:uncharacterized protein isoform X3 n=1 Tax=Asterias amurensis TaxID=7602 RepID=UPI003AB885E7